jgi:2-aminoethylphosphonate-pyruvate transaminase
MRVDLIVLDIAGTTVQDDDAVLRCLEHALARAGAVAARDEINRFMGMPKREAIAALLHACRGAAADSDEVEQIYAGFESRMIEHYRTSGEVRETPGASSVLRWLRRRGVVVALDTGFDSAITDVIVGRLAWAGDAIDFAVSSNEVARGRPHPDMVQRAMAMAGIADPARVAKVGDTPADLAEGAAARCGFVIGVTSGSHLRDALVRCPHTHLIGTLGELPLILDDSPAFARPAERQPGDVSLPLLFTPGPLTTSLSVKRAMLRDLGSRDDEFVRLVARLRVRLLALATSSPSVPYETVLIQGSGTYAVEAMIGAFVPANGRLLVLENGAYGARMGEIARALGIDVEVLRSAPGGPLEVSAVSRALARESAITHVAAVHCETTTGVLNPITAIGAVVRAAHRTFLVDAMSSFGAVELDLERDAVDALASSSNKCLEGVPGCAFVLARRDLLHQNNARSVALDLAAQCKGFERDGQFRFTPPTHVLLALDRALDELENEGGVAGRAARYRANHQRLLAGMRALGFAEVVAPEHQSDVITAFRCPPAPAFFFADFYDRLRIRKFVIYPGKLAGIDSFRIGTIGRLFPEDFDALVNSIREVLSDMGVTQIGTQPRHSIS